MKKIAMFIAAAAIAVSASAQKTTVTGMKASDNWYVGANAGATTISGIVGEKAFEAYNPVFGIRAGKNFTPIFGLQLDAQMMMDAHKNTCDWVGSKTFVQRVSAGLNATWNFSNLFAGYKGEPRFFEVIGVTGLGWKHTFPKTPKNDGVYAKGGVDFAFNLGADKAWQVYVEPAIVYGAQEGINSWKFDARQAQVQLVAGVNYKFGNSNGTHNFAIEQLRDQAEIDALNAKINAARAEADAAKANAAAKDAQIAQLKKALSDCENKPAQVVKETKTVGVMPSVIYSVGKSVIEKSQQPNVDMIATYLKKHPEAKVKISGYASPEGNAELNQKLSEARANAVKDMLVKKYKIAADRIETEGLGVTEGGDITDYEFMRVAKVADTTK